jgi:hypothetical protein
MAMELDLTDIGSEDDLKGQNAPLAGRYHVVVHEIDDTFERYDKLIVTFKVLAGTTPEQEGKTHREFFSMSEKAMVRVKKLCLVTGVIKPGVKAEVDFRDLIGRQLVIELVDHEYEDRDGNKKETVQIAFLGMWSLSHADASDVPKDTEAIAAMKSGATTSTTTSNTKDDRWADL